MAKQKSNTGSRRRLLVAAAAGLVLAGAGFLGWHWQSELLLHNVAVRGVQHAGEAEVLALADLDSVSALYAIEPGAVAGRVRAHPWVKEASVTRVPTGTLAIRVIERVPVVLVMDRQGRPAYYLDEHAFQLPLPERAAFDVPVLRGLGAPYEPERPVDEARLHELLQVLAQADDRVDALVSEIELMPSGEVRLYTTALEGRGSVPVRLGGSGFAEKLERLSAFWQQAVLTQPAKPYALIDLRFDGQVVTR